MYHKFFNVAQKNANILHRMQLCIQIACNFYLNMSIFSHIVCINKQLTAFSSAVLLQEQFPLFVTKMEDVLFGNNASHVGFVFI